MRLQNHQRMRVASGRVTQTHFNEVDSDFKRADRAEQMRRRRARQQPLDDKRGFLQRHAQRHEVCSANSTTAMAVLSLARVLNACFTECLGSPHQVVVVGPPHWRSRTACLQHLTAFTHTTLVPAARERTVCRVCWRAPFTAPNRAH